MKKVLISLSAAVFLAVGLASQASAEPRTEVVRTSPNHTKIVIHDTSPEAFRANRERARRARERRELKKQRAHELELAKIEAGKTRARQRPANPHLPSIAERQRAQAARNQPPAFFNGGQWTGGFAGGFGGFGPGFGFGFAQPGFGFVQPGFGLAPGFRGGGFRGCGVRRGFRGGFRGGGFRGGFRGGGFRGGGFRGGFRCR